MTREEIIHAARKEIGVKWQHQAALSGIACDCVGLIRLVGTPFGLLIDAEDLRYPRVPRSKNEELYDVTKKYLKEIPLAKIKPGDVLLFGVDGWPARHVGILSYDDFVIHTWLDVGKVVESRLDNTWRASMRYAFRFPGVTD